MKKTPNPLQREEKSLEKRLFRQVRGRGPRKELGEELLTKEKVEILYQDRCLEKIVRLVSSTPYGGCLGGSRMRHFLRRIRRELNL